VVSAKFTPVPSRKLSNVKGEVNPDAEPDPPIESGPLVVNFF
jgi:hypothetical protein